jgi:hypothetical protein
MSKKRSISRNASAAKPQLGDDFRCDDQAVDETQLGGWQADGMQPEEHRAVSEVAEDDRPLEEAADDGQVDDEELIENCVAIWQSRELQDLEARFSLGALLNAKFGHPKDRQQYGQKVFNWDVSTRIGKF